MSILDYFHEFDTRYGNVNKITTEFYSEIGIRTGKKINASAYDAFGKYSEEYIRARFVYSLVSSGKYPKENICIEFPFPKGNSKGTLNPDLIIFKDDNWYDDFINKNYKSLRQKILLIGETKKNNKTILNAVENQLRPAMQENESKDKIYGVYFDADDGILLYEKLSNNPITRFDINKSISSYSNNEDVEHRDDLLMMPSFNDLLNYNNGLLKKITNKKINEYTIADLAPLGNDKFDEIISKLKVIYDKIQPSIEKSTLIVEALTIKVFDEKRLLNKISDNDCVEVYFSNEDNEDIASFRKRIQSVYKKAQQKYSNILNSPLLKYTRDNKPQETKVEKFIIEAIKLFQEYAILKSENSDFNQIIFNNFASDKQKADKGQFFTPIPVVKAMVKMINPQMDEKVCDPCCGIADFLAMSFVNAMRGKSTTENISNFYGFDIEGANLKIAELNLVLNGDGGATLKEMDSLKNKLLETGNIISEDKFVSHEYNTFNWEHKTDNDKKLMKFDVVLTNPPFGKGRPAKIPSYLKTEQAELYEVWKVKEEKAPKEIDTGALFLENAYKLLNEGGRMGIVLSNSIASIKEWRNIRKWLLERMRIVALFDLPANTFGETGVATTVIIAYKPKEEEKRILSEDYEVFIKEINNIGYEWKTKNRARTNPKIEVIDEETFESTGEILEDFSEMQREFETFMNKQEKIIRKAFHYYKGI